MILKQLCGSRMPLTMFTRGMYLIAMIGNGLKPPTTHLRGSSGVMNGVALKTRKVVSGWIVSEAVHGTLRCVGVLTTVNRVLFMTVLINQALTLTAV